MNKIHKKNLYHLFPLSLEKIALSTTFVLSITMCLFGWISISLHFQIPKVVKSLVYFKGIQFHFIFQIHGYGILFFGQTALKTKSTISNSSCDQHVRNLWVHPRR